MAVRRLPQDFPDLQSAIGASAPGNRIEVGPDVFPPAAVVTVDNLTIHDAGSFLSSDVVSLGPGVRSLALPGLVLFRATGNDADNRIVGNDLDNRLVGRDRERHPDRRGGRRRLLRAMTASSRSTVTDFRPGAGSNDLVAFSADLFSSREQAHAASRQVGSDV